MLKDWTSALKGYTYKEGKVVRSHFTPDDLIAALESGKYKKGKRRLWKKDGNSFCCLGVAADMCGIPKTHVAYRAMPAHMTAADEAKFMEAWPWLYAGGGGRISDLAYINDHNETFQPVIDRLRSLK